MLVVLGLLPIFIVIVVVWPIVAIARQQQEQPDTPYGLCRRLVCADHGHGGDRGLYNRNWLFVQESDRLSEPELLLWTNTFPNTSLAGTSNGDCSRAAAPSGFVGQAPQLHS